MSWTNWKQNCDNKVVPLNCVGKVKLYRLMWVTHHENSRTFLIKSWECFASFTNTYTNTRTYAHYQWLLFCCNGLNDRFPVWRDTCWLFHPFLIEKYTDYVTAILNLMRCTHAHREKKRKYARLRMRKSPYNCTIDNVRCIRHPYRHIECMWYEVHRRSRRCRCRM